MYTAQEMRDKGRTKRRWQKQKSPTGTGGRPSILLYRTKHKEQGHKGHKAKETHRVAAAQRRP
jgi:hypothetical protein